ncbi:MAG: site-specific DNA-methyltransferase [Helicobacter sp.]|nr:site-specific DNA-methyltransferase [Helicobacter sp.]
MQKSGFINLLKIKSQYFKTIKEKLEKEEVKYPIYNKLYNFFGSYLNETGTPFFYDTPLHKNIYARVYTNSKDTSLFYKTQNLYYVKSDVIYHDAEIKSEDSSYTFIFDTSYFTPNSDNAKNKAIFKFKIDEEIRIYVLNNKEELQDLPNVFKQNSSDLSDEFIKALKDKQIRLQEEEIKKILYAYKKQNEVDFFIHKNARAFLQEQFNLWMFKYVVDDITDWSKEKIDELNQLKKIAFRIIDFIADFEDELKAIWCKPKFAKNVHYVFSLDTISNHARDSEQILESIFQDTGFKQQIKEWQELKLIDEHFEIKNINDEQYKFLPLDTKYLSEENYYKLLGAFDNLDEILHGELIKSDNFQALNSLIPKYQDKIDLIYIDPPFNTGSDFEYKDRFQDSTWLSLMHNRLELAKELLSDRGSFYLHLDHNANYLGRELLNEVFGEENFRNEIVWHFRTYQGQVQDYFPRKHNLIYWYTKNNQTKDNFFEISYSNNFEDTVDYKRWKEFLVNENEIRYPNYPKTDSRFEGYLNRYLKSVKKPLDGDLICKINGYVVDDVWIDIQAIDPKAKAERMESNTNLTQKPEALLQRIIKASSNEDSIVFDYHSGSGTTIATAHKLGRKWLGVEMGEHFYKVVIPRMKKVIGGFASGISKEVEFKGGGAFRYYELEGYEESLEQCEYVLDEDSLIDYRKSRKLIKGLKKGEKICLDMSEMNKNFDIFTTMSNLLGLKIKSIFLDENGIQSCKFENDDIANLENIDLIKYPKLRNLIWWEK